MVAAAGLFRRATTITMNKTVIQYRNKSISHYHDHAHDHVHLHGPGDWASLLIAVIVMVGIIIFSFFHFRCRRGSTATCDKPLGLDSRTVPLRWRGSDKHGGDIKLEARGYADINHGLGYINNIGLPVTGKHIRTIISFLTHERIITKIIAFYNV